MGSSTISRWSLTPTAGERNRRLWKTRASYRRTRSHHPSLKQYNGIRVELRTYVVGFIPAVNIRRMPQIRSSREMRVGRTSVARFRSRSVRRDGEPPRGWLFPDGKMMYRDPIIGKLSILSIDLHYVRESRFHIVPTRFIGEFPGAMQS